MKQIPRVDKKFLFYNLNKTLPIWRSATNAEVVLGVCIPLLMCIRERETEECTESCVRGEIEEPTSLSVREIESRSAICRERPAS